MDLQRLKYFVEVARQRHFSKAAEACRVSQPSLSQQIMKLEEELGGKLFERTREKVGLTALGQDFLKHARAIIAEVQAAEEFARAPAEDDSHRCDSDHCALPCPSPFGSHPKGAPESPSGIARGSQRGAHGSTDDRKDRLCTTEPADEC